ncbi:MAG: hypothetical protein AAF599_18635 [Bacteroidota bacterium]
MRTYFFIALMASLFLVACGGETTNTAATEAAQTDMGVDNSLPKEEQLYKQVLDYHDKIMPKMADINRIKRELTALENVPQQGKADVDAAINLLESVDSRMSNWMDKLGAFSDMNGLRAEADTSVIIRQLNTEMERGKALDKQIDQLIKMGERQLQLHTK